MRSIFTISQKCPRDLLYRELFRMQNVYPEDGRSSILGENIWNWKLKAGMESQIETKAVKSVAGY